jgi:RP/EB family microtubule-associated protein
MAATSFTPHKELVAWINHVLQLNIAKVEEISTGAIPCQLVDAMFPGQVALRKVNFKAAEWNEAVKNFKVLQTAFDKLQIPKIIPVAELVKGKRQDNLEFAQWLYSLYHARGALPDYDAAGARRAAAKSAKLKAVQLGKENVDIFKEDSGKGTILKEDPGKGTILREDAGKKSSKIPTFSRLPIPAAGFSRFGFRPVVPLPEERVDQDALANDANKEHDAEVATARAQLEHMQQLVAQCRGEVDYYFQDLAKIEDLCRENGEKGSEADVQLCQLLLNSLENIGSADALADFQH